MCVNTQHKGDSIFTNNNNNNNNPMLLLRGADMDAKHTSSA
jgi:hypothetical protein